MLWTAAVAVIVDGDDSELADSAERYRHLDSVGLVDPGGLLRRFGNSDAGNVPVLVPVAPEPVSVAAAVLVASCPGPSCTG